MSDQSELGKLGEELATIFLQKNGYNIHERNWRFKKGELDIIAEKNERMVFVEVKTRASDWFAKPTANVDIRKQRQITRAARASAE